MIRRLLQVVLVVLTLLVGTTAIVVIVSQTAWFKDWLRGYIVRQADQYLRGQLRIGRLGGDLFFGVELEGIEVTQNGQPVISIKDIGLDYSVLNFLTGALIFDDVRLNEPVVHVRRTPDGWNLATLVERRARDRDATGPNRPIHVGQIGISDGTLVMDRAVGTSGIHIPKRIDKLNARLEYRYEPVRSAIGVAHISFRGTSPSLQVNDTSGEILISSGRYEFRQVALRTAESALSVNGVIDRASDQPRVELRIGSEKLTLAEIARVVPALQGMNLQPAFQLSASGPPNAVGVDFAVQSTAGNLNGEVTLDATVPDRRLTGEVQLAHLDLAPLLKSDLHRSDINGSARIDLRFEGRGPLGPVKGRVDLTAPQARYAQYQTRHLRATTWIEPTRLRFDARGHAYGGPIAAAGSVEPGSAGRPLRFDLQGNIRHVNMRVLPGHLGVPSVASDVTGSYHVAGTTRRFSVRGSLDRSVVAGATFSSGTVVSLTRNGPDIRYTAEGQTSGLNLRQFGRSFGVSALNAELYESDLSGVFRVSGSGTSLDTLAIDASGTLVDSNALGAHVPRLTFDSRLHDRDLKVRAQGQFSGFNPAVLCRVGADTRIPEGDLSGTVDATFGVTDLGAPSGPAEAGHYNHKPVVPDFSRAGHHNNTLVVPDFSRALVDRLTFDGTVSLTASRVEQLEIEEAATTGSYRDRVARLQSFDLKSPSVQATASGTVALNETDRSDLQYTVHTTDAASLGSMAKLPIAGALHATGRITGNASELVTTGQMEGSDVRYEDYGASAIDSRYEVTVPALAPERAIVRAESAARTVTIGERTISEVKARTSYAEKRLDFDAAIVDAGREVQSNGSLTLHPDHHEVHLNAFSVVTEGSRWSLVPDAKTAVRYGLGRLDIDRLSLVALDGSGAEQRLFVDGTLGSGRVGLKIEATNVDLAPIDAIFRFEKRLQGRLSASALVSGTTAEPMVLGRFSLFDGSVSGYAFQSAVASVEKNADSILVDGTLDQTPGAGVTVKGRVPLALFDKKARESESGAHVAGPEMDVHVESNRVDLAILPALTKRLAETSGAARLDMNIRGTLRDPHLVGLVEIADAGFTVVPTAVAYHGAQVRLRFEPDIVRIERFQLIDEHDRSLRVSGDLSVHERTPGEVNLLVEGQRFEIIDNHLADIDVDVLLQVAGDLRRPRVRGQIELSSGSVNVDEVLKLIRRPAPSPPTPDPFDFGDLPALVSIDRSVSAAGAQPTTAPGQVVVGGARVAPPEATVRPTPPAPPLSAAAFFETVEGDVRFTIPNNLSLRGTELQADESALIGFGEIQAMFGGDLTIRKPASARPRLIGTINTVRGTYAFQGRRFELVRDGVIRFVGLEEIDPVLNISAERNISGVLARVHIGGTLLAPELTLSSQPPLDQTDILSLIAFNQPANQLGAGQRVSLAEQAAALGYGFAAGRLTRELGRALELDLLDIQPPSDVEGGASVTVGNSIGRSTFLKVTQRFGPSSATEVAIEHQLTDFMRLDAKGAQGLATTRQLFRRIERAGIDLVFFFSY